MRALLLPGLIMLIALPARSAEREVALHTIANRALGFTLDAPADAQIGRCDAQRCELHKPLSRGGSLAVTVERADAAVTLDQAIAFARTQGAESFKQQERKRSGHVLLVTAARGEAQDVWYFYNSNRSPLRVRCAAPPRLEERCVLIARSLRAMYVPPRAAPTTAPASAPASQPKTEDG